VNELEYVLNPPNNVTSVNHASLSIEAPVSYEDPEPNHQGAFKMMTMMTKMMSVFRVWD
jgi:hypothetical protein